MPGNRTVGSRAPGPQVSGDGQNKRRIFEVAPDSLADIVPHESPSDVDIVLPLYNAVDDIDGALRQIARLTGPAFHLIVVDDGSSDGTWDALLRADLPAEATLIRAQQNSGAAVARNMALRASSAPYVWMIDSDDHWPADALERLFSAARKHDVGLVVGAAEKHVTSSGERLPVAVPERMGRYDFEEMVVALLEGGLRGHLWNKLFARDRLGVDPFPAMRSKSDYLMLIRSLPRLGDMYVIHDVVYGYRYRPGSITNAATATPLDMFRCYEAAMELVHGVNWRTYPAKAVALFRYFNIAQIALAERWRYGDRAVNGAEAEAYARGVLTARDVARIVASPGGVRRGALAAGMKFFPGMVGRVYKARRRQRWGQ